MKSVKRETEMEWGPHPFLPIQIKTFLSRKDDQADTTIFLVRVPAGKDIPVHVHETQEDIIFIIAGKARMWIDGVGDFDLVKGTFVRVPKNTRHRIYDVTEDVLNYDVFVPPLF
ncbi:MAG TPA: cupin domain-containing protein [Thermodesulfobacteriota bacterium]|nr:cupin domain-containing protein [Thermodesulfobacteriota bacterium]